MTDASTATRTNSHKIQQDQRATPLSDINSMLSIYSQYTWANEPGVKKRTYDSIMKLYDNLDHEANISEQTRVFSVIERASHELKWLSPESPTRKSLRGIPGKTLQTRSRAYGVSSS